MILTWLEDGNEPVSGYKAGPAADVRQTGPVREEV